jgi:protein-disulfide isomerase-like protein with CxxC motif
MRLTTHHQGSFTVAHFDNPKHCRWCFPEMPSLDKESENTGPSLIVTMGGEIADTGSALRIDGSVRTTTRT